MSEETGNRDKSPILRYALGDLLVIADVQAAMALIPNNGIHGRADLVAHPGQEVPFWPHSPCSAAIRPLRQGLYFLYCSWRMISVTSVRAEMHTRFQFPGDIKT